MKSPRLRRGLAEDAIALAAFGRKSFTDAFAADNSPEDLAAYLAQTYGEDQQRTELTDTNMVTILAESGRDLVAFAQVYRSKAPECVTTPSPIELKRFYVDQSCHGTGLAQAMMREVRDTARALGAASLWLGVFERNPRAIRFYEKSGFTIVGKTVFVVGSDPQTDFVMSCPL